MLYMFELSILGTHTLACELCIIVCIVLCVCVMYIIYGDANYHNKRDTCRTRVIDVFCIIVHGKFNKEVYFGCFSFD